jgi:enamine deaminase RidA (YjgF/YER057c/UK114 family)
VRRNIPSTSPFAPVIGFSSAVRVGNLIFLSGSVGRDSNGRFASDVYSQTRQALANIASTLEAAGATIRDVVRTRMYVTNIDAWEEVAQAHREIFAEVMPAATLIEVSRLAAPEMLIEIEADAVIER